MRNINFLQAVLAVAAAGALCLSGSLPAHGGGGSQYAAMQQGGTKECSGDGCARFFNAEKCNGKTVAGKNCTDPTDKKKLEGEAGGKTEDFCRLKDLY